MGGQGRGRSVTKVRVGDAVLVSSIRNTRSLSGSAEGFVTHVTPGGVRVEFPEPINGSTYCLASHRELILIEAGGSDA